ncbi:MAG: VanW family protein [Gaiellaceae bacterium]
MQVDARTSPLQIGRSRPRRRRALLTRGLLVVGLLASAALVVGFVFAGSTSRIAAGVTVAGVDVGGMTSAQARATLERRFASVEPQPVTFTAAGHAFRISPAELGVQPDWDAAIAQAQRAGSGSGPLRGFKRLGLRLFGSDVKLQPRVFQAALVYELARLARVVDVSHSDAAVRLRGGRPVVVPGRVGAELDTKAAGPLILDALVGFQQGDVALPVRIDPVRVTAAQLAPAGARARTALSAPVTVTIGLARWRLTPAQLAPLLELPHDGTTALRVAGPAADAYFAEMSRKVEHAPVDASFAVTASGVRVVPARPGTALDVVASAKALLAAALSPVNRAARLSVVQQQAKRTTAAARAMGIRGVVSSYETYFGGVPNRIHNVQTVAHLVDEQLIKPGENWSFNGATGERTAAKGFLEAPVIINGEVSTGLGGGVCQVSTTVFNAAFEAGLPITERTNHALYISHYPLGRDATVNYPDVDLRFTNDTGHWLYLRTFVTSSSLQVTLYGTPVHRRVESTASPLVNTGPIPVQKVKDPTLQKGKTKVQTQGVPPQATSVERKVYAPSGKLLYDNVWHSSYRSSPTILLVGTKPKPKAKPGAGGHQPVSTVPTTQP